MKKILTVLTSLVFTFVLSIFIFGSAEQKTMQPMDTKMETMNKEMGDMEKSDMKKDMTGSMDKTKTM